MQTMKKTLFLVFFSLVSLSLFGQRYSINGYMTAESDGEPLLGGFIKNELTKQGTATNEFGHYSLVQKAGKVRLIASYVGYKPEIIEFTLSCDTTIHIALKEAFTLKEVVVTAQANPSSVNTAQLSAINVPIDQIKQMPSIFGETDVIKTLQLLPGVQGGTEGSAGVYVRGGGPDQNLIMMDGIPLYNVNHMLGLFSNFNPDAVKNVTLYKGSFPARFGGRLSSVIDVRMKDGNNKEMHGNVSIGLISSKFNLEGPIVNEKTTFNLSARRTYVDLLLRPLLRIAQSDEKEQGDGGYNFYDLNLKLSHKLTDKDHLFLTGYMGDDKFFAVNKELIFNPIKDKMQNKETVRIGWNWGNRVAALRWNHILNGKTFINTTVAYNEYRSKLNISNKEYNYTEEKESVEELKAGYNSGIRDLGVKTEINFSPNYQHNIMAGVDYTWHTFRPDVTTVSFKGEKMNIDINEIAPFLDSLLTNKKVPAHEIGVFVEDNISLTEKIKLNTGLKYTFYSVHGQNYNSFEPRVSLMGKITDKFSLKGGYALMTQYVHLLSTNLISLPTDLWVPATKRVAPMKSQQITAGAYYHWDKVGDFSIEGYYKKMNNLIEYKDGAGFLLQSKGWEDLVVSGDGTAFGVEFLYQKSFGNTTGWVGYTWSRSLRQFNRKNGMLNNGKPFPAKYDRIHDFSIAVNQKVTNWFDLSATWVFSTGNAATFGLQEYYAIDDIWGPYNIEDQVSYIEERNNFRYPNYHRLDISANFYKQHKRGKSTWNISVYNAYCQMNPFFILSSTKIEGDKRYNTLEKITPFPIIPSISYTYSF